MVTLNTIERSWVGAIGDHPIRVEEHQYDLSYIVEYYDDLQSEQQQCISYCPESDVLLTIEELQKGMLITALY